VATDFGVDVDARDDVPLRWGLCSGTKNLGNALVRRLLFLRNYVNAGLTPDGLSELRKRVRDAVEADPRVLSLSSFGFSMESSTGTLTIEIVVDTADGPFALVLGVTSMTVDILNNGVLPAAPAGSPATVATPVPGPAGLPGGPGPAGPKGDKGDTGGGIGVGGGLTFRERTMSSTGTEEVVDQLTVNFSKFPAGLLTIELAALLASVSGTATFKLRVGGTYGGVDGTVVATGTCASATPTPAGISGTLTNPTGLRPVKLTITSSGAGVGATVEEGTVTVTN
jgi:hypothetical protein